MPEQFDRFLEERLKDPEVRAAYGRAQARAQLFDDIREAFDSARGARLATVDDDLAFIADKLWEKGYRREGRDVSAD